ncbi:MAG: OmpA family protein [Gemmatimonadetes bacterium]|nr:OmpA family protein [Gemmatimonadota bacterium]
MNVSPGTPLALGMVVLLVLVSVVIDQGTARRQFEPAAATRELQATTPADEARRRAEVVSRVRATLEEPIFFDLDESAIRLDARRVLEAKLSLLQADSSIRLRVEGHADQRGSPEYNEGLAFFRASVVKDFFTVEGIDPVRIEILSLGKTVPTDSRPNQAGWAQNRRAEFRILAGRTVGQ